MTDIRRDEVVPVTLMFAYGFLAMTSYYILKPARNSVFVDRVGADNLDYIYILTAIFVSIVMIGYSRYVDRVRHVTLILGTFAFLASNLLAFWWLLDGGGFLTSGAFYIWGKLYPLLIVSQFWLVGNLLFSTRQAKRLFALVGLGPILGGVAGSTISGVFATVVGTRTLLLIAAGFLGLCAVLVVLLAPRIRSTARVSGRLMEDLSGDAFRLLRQSSHLRTIALILALTIVVGTLIDWQFNTAVDLFIPSEDQKTAFFGKFFALLNGGSVIVQLFATGFVLRKFGIGAAMLALPVGLLIASGGVIAVPTLLTAALLKGTEGGLRYSLDQSTRELLYLPVPTAVKYKVKPLIDLAVYRGGTGAGGIILLIVHRQLGFSIGGVAALCVGLICIWIFVTVRMRREFRESVKRLIGARDVDLEELIVQRLNAETLDELCGVLQHGSEQEVLYALDLLEGHAGYLPDDLAHLLSHDSAAVRARAINCLSATGDSKPLPAVRKLLLDPSLRVRVEAVHYVCRHGPLEAEDQMEEFLEDPNNTLRMAALAFPLYHEDSAQAESAKLGLMTAAASEQTRERRAVARELGNIGPLTTGRLRGVLHALMDDSDTGVRHEAVLAAAGNPEFLDLLVSLLCCRGEREPAREALIRFGPAAHAELLDRLRNPTLPERVRLELPALLYHETDQRTTDQLYESLPYSPPPVRFMILKTLDKLRRDRSDLSFARYEIAPLFEQEIREAYVWSATLHALREDGERRESLLSAAIQQRADEAAERALRVLGLRYPLEDLYAVHTGLRSSRRVMRERGFELLENTLPREIRSRVDPLLNPDASLAQIANVARGRYHVKAAGRSATLRALAGGRDRWVALLVCAELGYGLPVEQVPAPPFHEHSFADEFLRREGEHASDAQHEATRMSTTIDKAELLRRTDLFGRLRTEDQAVVAALTDEREFAADETIFREGDAGTELLIVVQGRVEARRDGNPLFSVGMGGTVGNLALLDGLARDYDAVAIEPTRVLLLSREAFYHLLEERFQLVRDVLSHISRVVRRLNRSVARSQ